MNLSEIEMSLLSVTQLRLKSKPDCPIHIGTTGGVTESGDLMNNISPSTKSAIGVKTIV